MSTLPNQYYVNLYIYIYITLRRIYIEAEKQNAKKQNLLRINFIKSCTDSNQIDCYKCISMQDLSLTKFCFSTPMHLYVMHKIQTNQKIL